ncbi:MAG: pseudouridine synthase [Rubrobacteraceae bacterium]|nr:rRNA pseudouridine synthase [Rubrobacter sp.]
MRLQAFLARSGAAPSRRKAEALIEARRVTVNGETASIGATVVPDDEILLDDHPVSLPEVTVSFALHKPAGYLTTLKDEPGRDRKTVRDLMPDHPGLVPAGRLDAATTGLLILTNDGRLANRITHPSNELDKEYLLTVENPAPEEAFASLAAGPTLEDGPMRPPKLTHLHRAYHETTFHLTIHEGRNRIIRRACVAVGLNLIQLHRLRVGPVVLGDLPEGHHRPLSDEELEPLR